MAGGDEWVSWPEAAEIVGCPVPTIDWYSRLGRIDKRPFCGARPTLQRSSVVEFAAWWRQRQAVRKERRDERLSASRRRATQPPAASGWLTTRQTAELLGVTEGHVLWLISRDHLRAQRHEGRWWVAAASADGLRRHREEERDWVSAAQAARIVGCSPGAIQRAARRGEIVQRHVARQRPSLARSSVETFGSRWTGRLAARATARNTTTERPASAPPDDAHEWLSTRNAAQRLGLSTSRLNQLARLELLPVTLRGGRRWYRADHLQLIVNARGAQRERHRIGRPATPRSPS
jgi:hypothetical protein